MKKLTMICLVLMTIIPDAFYAQAESIFNGVALEESLQDVKDKMSEVSASVKSISIREPSFPLSENSEDHLVCSQIQTENGMIEKAVFTFADGQLKYIMAMGNVVHVFTKGRTKELQSYLDFEGYFQEGLLMNKKKDLAWILTKDAMHPNLFSWENPYIHSDLEVESQVHNVPSFIKMGATKDELKSVFEKYSIFTQEEELDGSDPNAQVQINCFGMDALGFPRKIEARFGENKLNVVWILTGKGEEARMREALIQQYGEPIFINEDWEIFNDWQVGLRKDKPEVLLMERSIGLEYKKSYFGQ